MSQIRTPAGTPLGNPIADEAMSAEYFRRRSLFRRVLVIGFVGLLSLMALGIAFLPERSQTWVLGFLMASWYVAGIIFWAQVWKCPACGAPFMGNHDNCSCGQCGITFQKKRP